MREEREKIEKEGKGGMRRNKERAEWEELKKGKEREE